LFLRHNESGEPFYPFAVILNGLLRLFVNVDLGGNGKGKKEVPPEKPPRIIKTLGIPVCALPAKKYDNVNGNHTKGSK